jgi:NhaP-type Na+/H+ or K+/H+ antiporter
MEKAFIPLVILLTILILTEIIIGIIFLKYNKSIRKKLDEYKNTKVDSNMVMGLAFPFVLMSLESMIGILIILLIVASIFASYDYYIIKEFKKLKEELLEYTREE